MAAICGSGFGKGRSYKLDTLGRRKKFVKGNSGGKPTSIQDYNVQFLAVFAFYFVNNTVH